MRGAATEQGPVENYRSNIAQSLFYVDGKPFSLENYPMYVAIYDGFYPRILLKTGRQVAKSTTIASFMIAQCVGQEQFKCYYISPTQEQTRKFSHTRVAKILAYSPDLRRYFVGPESIDSVLLRMLRNGSEMAFTYALDDPDRARGYTANLCAFDEVQDILFEPVIPVIEECMSAQDEAYSMYCGTPKTMENTIEVLWDRSTRSEWCIKCDGCGKLTFIDSTKAVGLYGPVCLGCGKLLDVRKGRWIDMNPGAGIKGFHISQPMMPENVPACWGTSHAYYKKAMERWERILYKMENWGEVKFLNECIGVSTSTGARLLTKEILEGLCDPNYEMTRLPLRTSRTGLLRVVAGVDWSGGGGEVKGMEGLLKSRTVLHIWGDMGDGRLKTMYYKIFPNGHPSGWIDEICELCQAWGVEMICGDAGEGALANAMLRDKLGAHRVVQARYLSASKPIDWNPNTMAYHCDRTTLIDNYALFLTHQKAVYPKLSQIQPAIDDILNIYEETTMAGRKVWRHAATQPDDCFHAQLFGWLAWRVLIQDLRFYA